LVGTVPHYFPADCFGGSSDLVGTTTNTRHNHTTVPAQIWRELAPHYFLADCFGGSSDMAETTTKKLTIVLDIWWGGINYKFNY
jgi:hypothetical protein